MKKFLILILFFGLNPAFAEIVDTYSFQNSADRVRAVELAKSLRCPQCQNQNLVESNSPIAYDLRMEVYKLVDDGKSNQEIIATMTARFGDFVRYNPPFQWRTALLWLAPFTLLLLAGGWAVWGLKRGTADNLHNDAINVRQNAEPFSATQKQQTKKQEIFAAHFSPFILWSVLVAALLFGSLGYYFSLDRWTALQQNQQMMAQKQENRAQATQGERNEQYILNIQQKLRQDPNDGELWIELGQAYMLNNEFESALLSYGNAERLLGSQPRILGLAATALYYQNGQRLNEKATRLLNAALAQDSQETSSLLILAGDAFLKTDYQQALRYWQQILDSGRSHIDRKAIIHSMQMAERFVQNQP